MTHPSLELRQVVRTYGGGRSLRGGVPVLRAVDGVSLAVVRGRTLGIVGESGCGKSTLARIMVGLLPPTAGEILVDGTPITDYAGRDLYRKVQMVFQDPLGSLNPRKTVRQILEAPLRSLRDIDGPARQARVRELMELVSLRPEFADRYPHEFSGGQSQRIGIARALAADPEVVVLDEPVSALDVSVQAQVLALLADLQARLDVAYVFISHDLAVVEAIADTVLVMQAGRIVEEGEASQIFRAPQHDYTRTLVASIPGADRATP